MLVNARDAKNVPGRKTDVNDAQWLQQLDITDVTGMRIIRAIIEGVRDPAELARFRDVRCKASVETIQAALTGNYRPEQHGNLRGHGKRQASRRGHEARLILGARSASPTASSES